jgi:hypothetical protein
LLNQYGWHHFYAIYKQADAFNSLETAINQLTDAINKLPKGAGP